MTARAVQLVSREPLADRTVAFHFGKPAGFAFKPGQAIDLVLTGQGLPGPPAMVQAMQQTLAAAGIDEDDVRSEEFYGY